MCEQVDVCSLCVTKRIPVRTRMGTHTGCDHVGMCHLVCSRVSHEAVTPRVEEACLGAPGSVCVSIWEPVHLSAWGGVGACGHNLC